MPEMALTEDEHKSLVSKGTVVASMRGSELEPSEVYTAANMLNLRPTREEIASVVREVNDSLKSCNAFDHEKLDPESNPYSNYRAGEHRTRKTLSSGPGVR